MEQTEIQKKLGMRIRLARKRSGYSQTRVAELLSAKLGKDSPLSGTAITRLEQGQRPLTIAEGYYLAEIFGMYPAKLLIFGDVLGSYIDLDQSRLRVLRSERERVEIESNFVLRHFLALQALSAYQQKGAVESLFEAVQLVVMSPEYWDEPEPVEPKDVLEAAGFDPGAIAAAMSAANNLYPGAARGSEDYSKMLDELCRNLFIASGIDLERTKTPLTKEPQE